jgi:hypothetical protein
MKDEIIRIGDPIRGFSFSTGKSGKRKDTMIFFNQRPIVFQMARYILTEVLGILMFARGKKVSVDSVIELAENAANEWLRENVHEKV